MRGVSALPGFVTLVVRKIPVGAPYTLRQTARVPIAKFVGAAFKLGTNFAIAKDTSHSMPLVWL
jgi:hypothetical protein